MVSRPVRRGSIRGLDGAELPGSRIIGGKAGVDQVVEVVVRGVERNVGVAVEGRGIPQIVLGAQEMVMTPIKCDANDILEYDSIELVACAKCSSLGVLVNHHASRFYRCPDCKALCSV